MTDVDRLREQLRERGYLSHGIERWFALDPWSSRTFWRVLVTVALKAATLLAAFGTLPVAAVMVFRNYPLTVFETSALFVLYFAAWLAIAFALVVAVALVLKLRPELAVDTPRGLLAISLATATVLLGAIGVWWYGFDAPASTPELIAGLALSLLFFLVATVVLSAALLSFSIYELHRIPAIHQKPRGVPMAIAAAVLIALLLVPAYVRTERDLHVPMVVTTPTTRHVALVAVDGLTLEILASRPELSRPFVSTAPVAPLAAESTAERWATVGTGVRTSEHGVRAIAGIRLAGGRHILQRVSRFDPIVGELAPLLRIARREPLPPTVRRRDYVWEIFARYGVTSVAVNWWTSDSVSAGALASVSQESIFAASRGDALRVDTAASTRLLESVGRIEPRFATIYLPALDVVLNRLGLDESTRLTSSLRALDNVRVVIESLRARGYDVVLIGLPGEGQRGRGVLASTIPLAAPATATALDLTPTLATLLGFPLSAEMPGRPLVAASPEPRITTFGGRAGGGEEVKVDEEYYETLRSLGYIR